MKLYPMLLTPCYKELVWGGHKLKDRFQKPIPSDKTGESWELTCRGDASSIIANGPLKGKPLLELFQNNPTGVLGYESTEFPWLIKFIDASDTLSVQVHPDDGYAKANGDGKGKTEMWYILESEENARLILGFQKNMDRQTLKLEALSGEIEKSLNAIEVKPGDSFFIPSGSVHAIGAGILLCEIQQNSDATYRLYDWGRMGMDGKPRPLHLEKALDISRYSKTLAAPDKITVLENGDIRLCSSEFFTVIKKTLTKQQSISGLKSIVVLEGSLTLTWNNEILSAKAGDTVLIPFEAEETFMQGDCEILIVSLS